MPHTYTVLIFGFGMFLRSFDHRVPVCMRILGRVFYFYGDPAEIGVILIRLPLGE
jgi:hypothetical protein